MNLTNKRIISLDFARIYAVLGVLGIHLFYPIFSRPDFLGGKSWWVANIFHTLSLTSVPLLVMISGYLLVGKQTTIQSNLRRTWKRLVIPLLFWSVWYLFWNTKYNFGEYGIANVSEMVASGSLFHLYFLVILIGLYLLLPLLNRWFESATKEEKRYGFVMAWIVGVGMSLVYYLNIVSGPAMTAFTWWLPYLGYFLTGYLIKSKRDFKVDGRKLGMMLMVWYVFSLVMSYAGVQMIEWNWYSFWHPTGVYYFNTFLSPNVIIMSVGLFVWLVKSKYFMKISEEGLVGRGIVYLSSLTFGVYLVHFSVMDWVDIRHRYAIEFVTEGLRGFLIERTILVVGISFMVAAILKAIPGLRVIVGEPGKNKKHK